VATIQAVDRGGSRVKDVTISPTQAQVTFTVKPTLVTRTLPVVVKPRGSPPAGFRILSVQVQPALVTVSGPADTMARLKEVETEEVPLGGVRGPSVQRVSLAPPAGVTVLSSPTVTVTLEIGRQLPIARPGG